MTSTLSKFVAGGALLCLTGAAAAQATSADAALATTLKLVELLVQQGVLARDKADALIREAQQPAPLAKSAPGAAGTAAVAGTATGTAAGTVRVPYVPQFVRQEIKDELRAELLAQAKQDGWAAPGSVPDWVRNIKWDGDMRLRYQHDAFASGNAYAVGITDTNNARALTLANTTESRDRLRVRARIGLTAAIDEQWSSGFRLTTGNTTDPLSSNQTLGNYNARYTVAADRAYLRYRPVEWATLTGGRFANPWFGTDLVWANDLSFDGLSAHLAPAFGEHGRGQFTLAALPVQEVELSKHDKWLFGAQVGAEWKPSGKPGGRIGLGLYRYVNTIGQVSPAGTSLLEYTKPSFAQKGNTYYNISSDSSKPLYGLAANFKLVNLTASLDFPVGGANHIMLTGDYVKNLGYDRAAVSARVGADVAPRTVGYQLRSAFGSPEIRQKNDWQVYVAYKHLERDAVPDAFTDSDFRLGGTDARGYIVGATYGLGKNTSIGLRYLSADSIDGAPLSVDVLQVELSTHF